MPSPTLPGPTLRRFGIAVALLGVGALAAPALAHHGSAEYHVDREVVVAGTVKEWRWSNPHTRILLTATDGRVWDGEGPPLSWAQERGWSGATLRAGETVSLVMYPSRTEAHSGLVKRIERKGGALDVSRPWLERERSTR
jgi:hypothetical protein